MDSEIIRILATVLGSILGSGAVLGFVEFLIKRKDSKEEKSIDKKIENVEKNFNKGLAERENAGRERFEIHQEAIKEMAQSHKESFDKLLKAINSLKDHDDKVAKTLNKIADNQEIFGSSLLGLTHFELMYITNIILERKYITLNEKATIESMYEPYIKLGGNGTVKQNVTHVMQFPVITEEQAKKMDEEISALKIGSAFKK